MAADFTYMRKDGGRTSCFGTVQADNNYNIVCDDETFDGIVTDIDHEQCDTWRKICEYLEDNYYDKIDEIEAC